MALGPGSPVIDAIPVAECGYDDDEDPNTPDVPVETDQRGYPRLRYPCDIGAFEVFVNDPPRCDDAFASRKLLWPPIPILRPISIGGIDDPDGDAVSLEITAIFQDEPVMGVDAGITRLDALNLGLDHLWLRSERLGAGDGRVYHLGFTASDEYGATCEGSVEVCVPRSLRRRDRTCGDQGPLYDSTACGLGFELVLVLLPFMWARRRRSLRSGCASS